MRLTAIIRATSQVIKQQTDRPIKLYKYSRFVDSVRVKFVGGNGGDGCISMLSLFANEFAGPSGGNGGNGGHLVLIANREVKSLNGIASFYRGNHGETGRGKSMFGANAEHKFIQVPVGTTVTKASPKDVSSTMDPNQDPDMSDVVAHLDRDGSMFIAARGGAGGRGNASYLTNHNRHPRVAQLGAFGEKNEYFLRLRLYAHVGLIGLPNVGKSTLLNSLTGASVKIGNYSFTTLHPQVGVLNYPDYSQVAISDLPGLIEESSKNRGLGIEFLRHVKRCACLLYVIDLSLDPAQQMETLIYELNCYDRGLSSRPHIIFGNKLDHPDSEAGLESLKRWLSANRPNTQLITGSSLRGDNLEGLRVELKRMHDDYQSSHADEIDDALVW